MSRTRTRTTIQFNFGMLTINYYMHVHVVLAQGATHITTTFLTLFINRAVPTVYIVHTAVTFCVYRIAFHLYPSCIDRSSPLSHKNYEINETTEE